MGHSMLRRSLVVLFVALSVSGAGRTAFATNTSPRSSSPRSSSASARVASIFNPSPGVHVTPTRSIAAEIDRILPAVSGNLTNHGGPVLLNGNNSVPIFWMPAKLQDGTAVTPAANYV